MSNKNNTESKKSSIIKEVVGLSKFYLPSFTLAALVLATIDAGNKWTNIHVFWHDLAHALFQYGFIAALTMSGFILLDVIIMPFLINLAVNPSSAHDLTKKQDPKE